MSAPAAKPTPSNYNLLLNELGNESNSSLFEIKVKNAFYSLNAGASSSSAASTPPPLAEMVNAIITEAFNQMNFSDSDEERFSTWVSENVLKNYPMFSAKLWELGEQINSTLLTIKQIQYRHFSLKINPPTAIDQEIERVEEIETIEAYKKIEDSLKQDSEAAKIRAKRLIEIFFEHATVTSQGMFFKQFTDLNLFKKVISLIPEKTTFLIVRVNSKYINADAAVKFLAESPNLSQLVILDLSTFNKSVDAVINLTDKGLLDLINSPYITHLKQLTLSFNPNITDGAIAALASSPHFSQLQHLNLSFCKSLTDAAITPLANSPHLAQLEHLDLSFCDHFTDVAYKTLTEAPKLQELNLLGCKNLTEDDVIGLQESKPDLTLHFWLN